MSQYPPLQTPPLPPNYTLYDSRSVGLATFFGTPVAGTFLMALNYHRLHKTSAAITTFIIGVVATAFIVALGIFLPLGSNVNFPIAIVVLLAITSIAKQLQGPSIAAHLALGGCLASRWKAFGISLTALVIVLTPIATYVIATSNKSLGTRLTIGTHDAIFYSGSSTPADAAALGAALKSDGYFTDKGANVLLQKTPDATILSFVVKDGVWDDPTMVQNFQTLTRSLAPTLGALPIKLRLLDSNVAIKKEIVVQ
jgi:hypothetical protein